MRADSATIARELERRLASDGERAEVINLGVIAATLDHLTILARDAIPLLRPTDVVVVLYANDLPAAHYNADLRPTGPEFPPLEGDLVDAQGRRLFLRFTRDEPISSAGRTAPIRFFPPCLIPPTPGATHRAAGRLDPALYQAMTAGTLNPWLNAQSTTCRAAGA